MRVSLCFYLFFVCILIRWIMKQKTKCIEASLFYNYNYNYNYDYNSFRGT